MTTDDILLFGACLACVTLLIIFLQDPML